MGILKKFFAGALRANETGQSQKNRAASAGQCRQPAAPLLPGPTNPAPKALALWQPREDGAELLAALTAGLRRHVFMPDRGAAELSALWVVHAHSYAAAETSPLLAISAPTIQCGKTTMLRVLTEITPAPLLVTDMTAPGLYRNLTDQTPTLLIDDGDILLRNNRRLQVIINSGHCRSGAGVLRADGLFDVRCPKAIALMGELPAASRDRALRVYLKRKRASETVTPLNATATASLQELRARAARWSAQHCDALAAADPVMPDNVINRTADNFRAILAIADIVGGPLPELIRALAVEAMTALDPDEMSLIALLREIRGIIAWLAPTTDRISTRHLLDLLHLADPWDEYNRGGPLRDRQLAQMLHPFGIKPQPIRFEDGLHRGYYLAALTDACERYL
jgi:Protein of unknown function (DUF3631)